MIAADRALAGVVLALVATAALVQPASRAIDPLPAQMVAARDAWFADEPVDPWGRPWYVHATYRSSMTCIDLRSAGFASLGPDGAKGFVLGGDQFVLQTIFSRWSDDFAVGTTGVDGSRHASPLPETRLYELAPFPFLGLVIVLLLTRALSGRVRRRAGVPRFLVAGALALLPSAYTWGAIVELEATPLLVPGAGVVVIAPALAITGSIFVLFFSLVFVHRELGDVPAPPRPRPLDDTTGTR